LVRTAPRSRLRTRRFCTPAVRTSSTATSSSCATTSRHLARGCRASPGTRQRHVPLRCGIRLYGIKAPLTRRSPAALAAALGAFRYRFSESEQSLLLEAGWERKKPLPVSKAPPHLSLAMGWRLTTTQEQVANSIPIRENSSSNGLCFAQMWIKRDRQRQQHKTPRKQTNRPEHSDLLQEYA
jgi:hypothetical protein